MKKKAQDKVHVIFRVIVTQVKGLKTEYDLIAVLPDSVQPGWVNAMSEEGICFGLRPSGYAKTKPYNAWLTGAKRRKKAMLTMMAHKLPGVILEERVHFSAEARAVFGS